MDGFIIACVYQFLLDQGWTEEEFWNYEDKENYGVDVVIHRTHYPATHGAMSKIMTVAEKNVWLAKHKIEAVLSDEVPYCVDFRTCEYINDYSQLENYINPYQDYVNYNNRDGYIDWFNMELLANPCFDEMIPEKISEWIQEDYSPDFEKWFNPVDDKIVLSTFTNVQNNLSGVEEAIWISSGVCAADSFSRFLELLDRSDKTFVVWIEEDGYKYKELKEIKPTIRAVESNLDMTDTLKSILGQYIGLSKDISDEQSDMNNVNDIEGDCSYD